MELSQDYIMLTACEVMFGVLLGLFVYYTLCTTQFLVAGSSLVLLYVGLTLLRRKLTGAVDGKGRAVFITGCDTGFGHDLARRLDELGFTVFAGCLAADGPGAKQLKQNSSKSLHLVPLDVCKDESVVEAHNYVHKYTEKTGIWAVVNNAGVFAWGDVEWCTLRQYKTAMEVNLFGTIRVTKAFIPSVRQCKGRIVMVSSCRGRFTFAGDSAYSATKFAMETVSDALRFEMLKFGVKVVIVEPGVFAGVTAIQSDAQLQRFRAEADEQWASASDDTRSVYGRAYLDGFVSGVDDVRSKSAVTTEPVIDVLERAVTSERPDTRYTIGGGSGWIDIYMNLGRVYGFVPTWLYDWFVVTWFKCDRMPAYAKPAKDKAH